MAARLAVAVRVAAVQVMARGEVTRAVAEAIAVHRMAHEAGAMGVAAAGAMLVGEGRASPEVQAAAAHLVAAAEAGRLPAHP